MDALARARELRPSVFSLSITKSPPADTLARLIAAGIPEQAAADVVEWQSVRAAHLRVAARDAALAVARQLLPEVFREEDPPAVLPHAAPLLREAGVSGPRLPPIRRYARQGMGKPHNV
jgi:hypothetical protein